MELTFYKYAATPERVDKTQFLTVMGNISNVVLKQDTNLLKPTFILSTNPIVYNSNYMYSDFTQRYYFINNITALAGQAIAIDATVDVLYTYKKEILASSAWVKSSGGVTDNTSYDMMHNDFPFQEDVMIGGIDFTIGGNPFVGVTSLDNNFLLMIK